MKPVSRGYHGMSADAEAVFRTELVDIHRRSDRVFAWLMAAQWAFAVILALTYSPYGWEGKVRSTHIHVLAAVILGGLLSAPVIALTLARSGSWVTRQTVTIVQFLWSALLIHLTGGRIETHFHVFGSLAFIAFYRDWTLLLTGTVVVASDHLIRGIWWPESVYGIPNPEWWRFLEHAFWVLFEDIVLVMGIRISLREMRSLAERQEALRRSAASARLVAHSASDGIITIDEDDRLSFVNPAAASLFGFAVEDLLGRPVSDVIENASGIAAAAIDRRVVECSGTRKDGTEVPLEVSFGELTLDDVTKRTAFLRDITERKKVDRLKSELLSTVSHELRTPLTSLRGFVELLLNRSYPAEKQRSLLTIVHRESIRLTNLINDFLDIQRIESGRQSYTLSAVDLSTVARDTAAVFSRDETGRRIVCRIPADLPPVTADIDRVRQIFSNLISNALKFSTDGGEVVIDGRADADCVTVSVTDRGIGIPPDALPHLFTRFFRVDNRETRSVGGSGLGLALTRELIEAQHGRIWVESSVGRGSTFSFSLPRAKPTVVEEPSPPPSALPEHSEADVLIVEDNPAYSRLLGEHLQEAGCSVVKTAYGEEAVKIVRARLPRVIMLDVHLGGSMDGWEVLVELKRDPATRAVPVILITLSEKRLGGLALEGAEILNKPLDLEALSVAIRRVVDPLAAAKVLVVDDDSSWRHGLAEALSLFAPGKLDIAYSNGGRDAISTAFEWQPDLVLLDLGMPDVDGMEVLRQLRTDKRTLLTSVIVITGRELNAADRAEITGSLVKLVHKDAMGTGSRPLAVEHALSLLPAPSVAG